jgi:predicted Zn-dependent protease
MTRRARATLLALAVALPAACVRNPVTGKRQLSFVSTKEEIAMGQQGAEEVKQTMGVYPDQKLQQYVSSVGMRMAKSSERPDLPWSFTVIDDPTVNAFALPGGPIFITRGILGYMTTEAEMASVLGHEIGHVTARHSAEQMTKQQIAQVGLGIGSILSPTLAALGQAASAGMQLLFLKYSRDDERMADRLGFGYMHKAGYDPRQMAQMFVTLQRYTSQESGGGRVPEWMQTHPDPGNRVTTARERVAQLGNENLDALKVNRDAFLGETSGIVFGDDPRQGFFKGDTFEHPALGFQITFPSGWKKQNSTSAVAAQSPKQDAILQLQSAGKSPPDQALKQFMSQQGVQAAQAGKAGGLPPASSYFQADTQQGPVAGVVTFVSHGGSTLGIVGYAPAQAFPGYDDTFKRSIASFGSLQDPSARDVKPSRVEVVRPPRDTSVPDFNKQYPSTVPLAVVATVNEVDPNGVLKAGQPAKRITGGTPMAAQK